MATHDGPAKVEARTTAEAPLSAVRVLIVEDNGEARRHMRSRLEAAGMHVVGDAATVGEALTMARECRPAIALLDIALDIGTEGGLGLIAPFRELGIACVMCSGYERPVWAARAREYGAAAYLVKGVDTDGALERVLERVANGERHWPARILERINALPTLNGTEREALDQLREGKHPKQIKAGYSSIRSLKKKLGVRHIVGVLVEALRLGYHWEPDPIQEENARRRKSTPEPDP